MQFSAGICHLRHAPPLLHLNTHLLQKHKSLQLSLPTFFSVLFPFLACSVAVSLLSFSLLPLCAVACSLFLPVLEAAALSSRVCFLFVVNLCERCSFFSTRKRCCRLFNQTSVYLGDLGADAMTGNSVETPVRDSRQLNRTAGGCLPRKERRLAANRFERGL
ncbi:hypothetical protein TGVAND_464988 [Toxoplasma gondii VAND]|uniref:Transmembrane protein n=1 Tax=Toxoplasma gondii VAND TaxID=933077 RepID=A0A086PGB2_TOXGO|nr:hypothetical protein TGVAND_464988 [Toxoplasma gondii VAND]